MKAQLRILRKRYRKVVHSEKPREGKLAPEIATMALGTLLAGVAYTTLFTPLAWQSARSMNLEPVATLLLLDFPPQLDQGFFGKMFPRWSAPEARPVLYSLAALCGVIGVVTSLAVTAGGLLRLAMEANGLLLGFYLTRHVATEVLGIIPAATLQGRLMYFKLAYLMLSYYATTTLTTLLSKDDLARKKFDFGLSGAHALFTGWILTRGFGSASAVYAGAVYLLCTFATLATSEVLFRRVSRFAKASVGTREWTQIDRERYLPVRALIDSVKSTWRNNRILVLIVAMVNVLFPAAVVAIYHVALEGKW